MLLFSPGDAIKLKQFAMVDENPEQSRIMLKKWIHGNYCRCMPVAAYLLKYLMRISRQMRFLRFLPTEFKMFDGHAHRLKKHCRRARLKERFGSVYVIDFLRIKK